MADDIAVGVAARAHKVNWLGSHAAMYVGCIRRHPAYANACSCRLAFGTTSAALLRIFKGSPYNLNVSITNDNKRLIVCVTTVSLMFDVHAMCMCNRVHSFKSHVINNQRILWRCNSENLIICMCMLFHSSDDCVVADVAFEVGGWWWLGRQTNCLAVAHIRRRRLTFACGVTDAVYA